MRFALALLGVVIGGCASSSPGQEADYSVEATFVAPLATPCSPSIWVAPSEMPTSVQLWSGRDHHTWPSYRIEPMPFGHSSFGPWSVPTSPSIEREPSAPDPSKPITIDFVQKDGHTALHWLSLRLGKMLSVEKTEGEALLWDDGFNRLEPNEALKAFAELNKFTILEDGDFIILKRRQ